MEGIDFLMLQAVPVSTEPRTPEKAEHAASGNRSLSAKKRGAMLQAFTYICTPNNPTLQNEAE